MPYCHSTIKAYLAKTRAYVLSAGEGCTILAILVRQADGRTDGQTDGYALHA